MAARPRHRKSSPARLQDHKRATVIGTRSFGKGSVQTIIPLGSQGALRLTTARYYTPAGRSIQAKGIDPDIVIEQELPPELQGKDTSTKGEASLRGHLNNEAAARKAAVRRPMCPKTRPRTCSSRRRSICSMASRL